MGPAKALERVRREKARSTILRICWRRRLGFFAIIDEAPRELRAKHQILECHLNVWSLDALLGRRLFLFDVGVALHIDAPLSQIDLVIPFATENDGFADLAPELFEPDCSELIFGVAVKTWKQTSKTHHENIDWGAGAKTVLRVAKDHASPVEDWGGTDYSRWRLRFGDPLQAGDYYFRVRFRIRNLGSSWVWKRFGIVRTGAIADLRVNEIREMEKNGDWKAVMDSILPIDKLFLFVTVPSYLHLESANPQPRYIRLLEIPAWRRYLHRKPTLGFSKFVIYSWVRSRIDWQHPLRVFFQTNQNSALLTLGSVVQSGLLLFATIVAAVLLTSPPWNSRDVFDWIADGATAGYGLVINLISLVVVLGVAFLISLVGRVRRRLKSCYLWVDEAIYGAH